MRFRSGIEPSGHHNAGAAAHARGAARAAAALLVAGLIASAGALAEPVRLTAPASDIAVIGAAVPVEGEAAETAGPVRLLRNGELVAEVPVSAGRFRYEALALNPGVNVIEADVGEQKARVLLVRIAGFTPRAAQKVRFQWDDGVDDQIRAIALETRSLGASEAQLAQFAAQVRARTEALFADYFRGVARIELVSAAGADVTSLRMTPLDGGAFGRAPADCGNVRPNDTVAVFAGFFRKHMANHPQFWSPMSRSDSIATRAEDVAQALARTAAHEFAHAIGLTEHRRACNWMEGDGQGHNSRAVNENPAYFRLAARHAGGWHVMDPGPDTPGHIRIGEASAGERSAQRRRGHFEPFSASYLSILHPLN